MCDDDRELERRASTIWITVPHQDYSGLKTHSSEKEAREFAKREARDWNKSIAVYRCEMLGKQVPVKSEWLPI